MKTITIQYTDIGRGKASFRKTHEAQGAFNTDMIAGWACEDVKGHILSRFPDAEYDIEENRGVVICGFRPVGTFTVVRPTS